MRRMITKRQWKLAAIFHRYDDDAMLKDINININQYHNKFNPYFTN